MPAPNTAARLTAIEARLDELSAQLGPVVEEARHQRKFREQVSELNTDLAPVVAGAMDLATAQLAELDQEVDLAHVGRLARTLARNIDHLEGAVAQLEAISSLAAAVTDLMGPAMESLTARLQDLEDRGYFDFARQGAELVDLLADASRRGELDRVRSEPPPSLLALLRRARSPEARRGLATGLTLLAATGCTPTPNRVPTHGNRED